MPDPKDILAELRELPPVDAFLTADELEPSVPRELRLAWIRETLEEARTLIRTAAESARQEGSASSLPAMGRPGWTDWVARRITEAGRKRGSRMLRGVVNATGVLLHTNLGRAPLSAESIGAILTASGGYSNLETDLESGRRRSRLLPIRRILPLITGAEAGLAVHNNAAAIFLALSALAQGKEVLVSRAHLVEIGGSFRLSTIMEASGARLVEVGSTNRTRIADYAEAITPETRLILKVHQSNFKIVGFTEEVSTADLGRLAREKEILLFDDLGSGALVQHEELSFDEPRVQDSLEAGADLVTFSGDKLLGGPQAGILVGRASLVEKLAKHPVARVVRLDKTILAALEATLEAYLDPETLRRRIPLLAQLSRRVDDLEERARHLAGMLQERLGGSWDCQVVTTAAEVGGGSLPGIELESRGIVLHSDRVSPDSIASLFRGADPPVIGYIEKDRFLLDMRTLLDGDEMAILGAADGLAGLPGGSS